MSKRGMVRAAARRRAKIASVAVAAAGVAGVAAPSASAIEVNSLADPGNGNCNDGTCTLREALDLSDSTPATTDTITFKSGLSGTIHVNGTAGNLDIYWPVTIQGPGPDVVTISGDSDSNGTPDTRVLYTFADGVTISGLTFAKGAGKPNSAAPTSMGGAIYMFASTVTLDDVVITGSAANAGAGIRAGDTQLVVSRSSIVGNDAAGRGGAIDSEEALGNHPMSLIIDDSLIAGNDADYGGGIFASDSSVQVERSTISGNTAGTYGAGGLTEAGTASIESSTISGNDSAVGGGGWAFGISSTGSRLVNSTVAGNVALYAGGVMTTAQLAGQIGIVNSIVADNGEDELLAVGDDPAFTIASSLVERPETGAFTQAPGSSNIIGADPQLGPLADNSGLLPTMQPALTSPAIDAGNANGFTTDQRGAPRTVDQNTIANGPGSDGTDIGAVERGDETDPLVTAEAKGKAKADKAIKIVVGSDEAGRVSAEGTAKAGKRKVKLKDAHADVPAGGSVTLKLKLAKRPARILRKAGKGKATIDVAVEDATGNTGDDRLKVKLK